MKLFLLRTLCLLLSFAIVEAPAASITSSFDAANYGGAGTFSTVYTSGNVGAGLASTGYRLEVLSGTANAGTGGIYATPTALGVTGPDAGLTDGAGTVYISSNDAFGIDKGPSIAFSARYLTASANDLVLGKIKVAKETSGSGNQSSYMAFATRNHNTGILAEAIRLTSDGSLKVTGAIVNAPVNGGAITTGGTIDTTVGTNRVQPAAAVTGMILEAGVADGQRFTLINESAAINTITMDAAGTSNVADGVTTVVAGLTAQSYYWTAGAARWFPEK